MQTTLDSISVTYYHQKGLPLPVCVHQPQNSHPLLLCISSGLFAAMHDAQMGFGMGTPSCFLGAWRNHVPIDKAHLVSCCPWVTSPQLLLAQ